MSLGSVLGIARSGMSAQQLIIDTAGHNIANVDTEGYSRQRVELSADFTKQPMLGQMGNGVRAVDIAQLRDFALDTAYRDEASGSASSQLRKDLLGGIESLLGEPSDTGLAAAMDAFWSSWSDLASQPASSAARSVVQQNGQHVAEMLNGFDRQLVGMRQQVSTQLDQTVTRINQLSDQIAGYNERIMGAEVGGTTAADLRDKRNLAIDELAKLGDTHVIEYPNGSLQVSLGTNTLVDGTTGRHARTIVSSTGVVGIHLDPGNEPALPFGGTSQAMLDFMNRDLPDVRGQLDALANGLVTAVNAIHATGELYPATGAPVAAGNFFDPTHVTAGDISLSAAVAASAQNIAAGAAAAAIPGPGNNDVALALAGLRSAAGQVTYVDTTGQTQSGSFTSFYGDVASRLGARVSAAGTDADVHATLADQADTRRKSVSGVNLDEELTTLMRAQQAYAAAAKVISTASDMMKTLVDMI